MWMVLVIPLLLMSFALLMERVEATMPEPLRPARRTSCPTARPRIQRRLDALAWAQGQTPEAVAEWQRARR